MTRRHGAWRANPPRRAVRDATHYCIPRWDRSQGRRPPARELGRTRTPYELCRPRAPSLAAVKSVAVAIGETVLILKERGFPVILPAARRWAVARSRRKTGGTRDYRGSGRTARATRGLAALGREARMRPILFVVPGSDINVHSYGVMIFVACFAALAIRSGARRGNGSIPTSSTSSRPGCSSGA